MIATKTIIRTENSPPPAGPFSQAVRFGEWVFVSGQVAVDAEKKPIGVGDIEAQTRQVLMNLKAILEAAGSSLECIVKTTVFLQDMAEWPRMNAVYQTFFPKDPPARSAVRTDFSGLKTHWRVEIEAIAHVKR